MYRLGFTCLFLSVMFFTGCSGSTEATCVDTVCLGGEARCEGNAIATCSADGKTWTYSDCGAEQRCEAGACVKRICTDLGGGWCDDDQTLKRCTLDGMSKVEETCAEGTKCVSGECVPSKCTQGDTACAFGDWLLTCQAGTWTGAECEGGQICDDASGTAKCTAAICTPETARCEGNVSYLCDHIGRTETATTCGDNQVCKGGYCVNKVCGLDDIPAPSGDATTDAAGVDGDATASADTGPEDTWFPPLEPIARVEFELAGNKLVFDLNARANYIGSDKQLVIIGEKGLAQIEIRIGPLDPFVVGSWNESDGAEIGVVVCYNDGVSPLPEPLEPCQVGFTHVSIEYALTLNENNGPDSWLRGDFTATLEDAGGSTIRINEGLFEVLHK